MGFSKRCSMPNFMSLPSFCPQSILHLRKGRRQADGAPEGARRSMMKKARLGVGFVGAGFVTRFHIESFQGVRDADVAAVMAPTRQHAEEAAALASRLGVGEAKVYGSVADMVADPAVDALC